MIDTLPNDILVYSLGLLRFTALARGTVAPSRKRLYTPAQYRVYQRSKAQIQRQKRRAAR